MCLESFSYFNVVNLGVGIVVFVEDSWVMVLILDFFKISDVMSFFRIVFFVFGGWFVFLIIVFFLGSY